MWHTSGGDRKLEGNEKIAFVQGVKCLVEDITGGAIRVSQAMKHLNDLDEFGDDEYTHNDSMPTPFRTMSNREKIVALAVVSKSMLDDSPVPELFAWNEATVASIYEALKIGVEVEIDMGEQESGRKPSWMFRHRKAIFPVCKYVPDEDDDEDYSDLYPSKHTSKKMDRWKNSIEKLKDSILWDEDYDMDFMHDAAPDTADSIKTWGGIAGDYYSEPSPPDTQENLLKSLEYLLDLTKDTK